MTRCPKCKEEISHLCAAAEVTRTYHVHIEDDILQHTFSGVKNDIPDYVYSCPKCGVVLSFSGFAQVDRFLRGEQVI